MTPEEWMDSFHRTLIDTGVAIRAATHGCSNQEIAAIARSNRRGTLPTYYDAFLRVMGRSAGAFRMGTDVFYPRILGAHEAARALLGDAGLIFPADAVVWSLHQGYTAEFLVGTQDDPPVYRFTEGDQEIRRLDDSFSEYLTHSLDDLARQAHTPYVRFFSHRGAPDFPLGARSRYAGQAGHERWEVVGGSWYVEEQS